MKNLRIQNSALAALTSLSLILPAQAQLAASGTPGDRAVYTVGTPGSIADKNSLPGNSLVHAFDTETVADTADSFDLGAAGVVSLSAGHHLVLYGNYFTSVNDRAQTDSFLKLNGTAIAYGASSGYTRDAGNNDLFARGGTILNVAQGDTIEVETERVDVQVNDVGLRAITEQSSDLQLLKLDDANLSFLRLRPAASTTIMAAQAEGPVNVAYDAALQDEIDPANFAHDPGSNPDQITLKSPGHYLVFANTGVTIGTTTFNRNEITQQIRLGGASLPGGATTVYVRHSSATDGAGAFCDEGTASIGVLVEVAAPNTILEVQITRDNVNSNSTVSLNHERTGIAIAKLPSYGDYIALSGGAQNVNTGTATVRDFSASGDLDNDSFNYASATNSLTVKEAADYLFLSSHYGITTSAAQTQRAIVRQDFQKIPSGGSAAAVGYGGGGVYNRDDHAGGDRSRRSGTWAGAVLPGLGIGDAVETTTQGLSSTADTITTSSLGIQGINLASISTPPADPIIVVNNTLTVSVNTAGTLIDDTSLVTTDSNTPAGSLVYTIDSPITGGALNLAGTGALAMGGMFTQENLNNGDLTFDAGAGEAIGGGFDFTVSDGGASPASDTFTINVTFPTAISPDAGTADEDNVATEANLTTGASLLANDVGSSLSITASDAVSANGAGVSVNANGTFTYDPTGSTTLQALDTGESVMDTFGITITDFFGVETPSTVTITVDGVNDDPVTAGESVTRQAGNSSLNILANESDADAADVLLVSNFDAAGSGGAVPTTLFDGSFVPLVFTSAQGATVTISADGELLYDVSTSSAILNLSDGASLSETFSYDVFDGTATVAASITITSVGAVGASDDLAAVNADLSVNFNALTNDSVYSGAPGAATAGPSIEFVQGTVGNNDTDWINTQSATTTTLAMLAMSNPGVESVLDLAIPNPPAGFTSAYSLTGNLSGALHASYEDASMGDLDATDTVTDGPSFELWFRPSDQTGIEVLWEGGGNGNGTSLILIDDVIVFTESDTPPDFAQASALLPAGAVAGGEFVHVVGQVDLTNDLIRLYVNGTLADERSAVNISTGAVADLTDLAGIDGGGLGVGSNTIAGEGAAANPHGVVDTSGHGPFNGEIAVARAYPLLLSAAEVLANYTAGVGATASPAGAGDVTDLDAQGDPQPGPTTVTIGSGALVTFETDGTFTYDPNGIFDTLAAGLTVTDTFTYQIGTDTNSLATARVVVTGVNTDPAITITASQPSFDEGTAGAFSIAASTAVSGPVTVNLLVSGSAVGSGEDYAETITSVVIPDGGLFAPALQLNAIADNLFEDENENVVITIDSVVGTAVIGAPNTAESFINDLDPAPVVNVAATPPAATEGGNATFTITPVPPSDAPITVDLSYAGTATAGADYFSGGLGTLVIPALAPSASLDVFLFDDGVADGGETLTATIDSVSQGSTGTASDSVTISDGAGECLFLADFNGVNPALTTGGTLLGADAPEAANLGTAVGSWENVPTQQNSGDSPGIRPEIDDVKGDGIDEAFVVDRPIPVPAGGVWDLTARLKAPADLSGSNTAYVSMDLGNRRTQNNSEDKSWRIVGVDAVGAKLFELYVSGNNNGANAERLSHVDSGGTLTPLGSAMDFDNTGSIEEESEQSRLVLSLTPGGYQVGIDRWPIDGVLDSVSGTLAYAGPATSLSGIVFQLASSTNDGANSGVLFDDVKVGGIRTNLGPSITLDGSELADSGSTGILFMIANSTKTLSSADNTELQIVDPDAATVSVDLEAVNSLGTISVGGPATVDNNGTGLVTVSGSPEDVNTSLAAGVAYTAGGSAGSEILRITVDDGGSSGVGGALSSTHDLTFDIFADPTVVINQASGQADPTNVDPINFTAVFSEPVDGFGAEASDVDLSASTTGGTLTAVVTGGPMTFNVAVSGMAGDGDVIVSIPAGAAQRPVTLEDNVASGSTDNVVAFELNDPPAATNLVQAILYPEGAVAVDLDDIAVSDADEVLGSALSSATVPFVDFPAVDVSPSYISSDPANGDGLAMEICFTPEAADVAVGGAGTETRRIVFNIGGSSNGSGIYMIEGIPYFISKMNSTAAPADAAVNDLDWATAGMVVVPLSASALPAGVPNKIALIFDLDTVEFSVNGSTPVTTTLLNRGTRSNWAGDNSIRINAGGGPGGLSNDAASLFFENAFGILSGPTPVAYARMINDAAGTSIILPPSVPEAITATLTLANPANGALSAGSGNGETYTPGTGVWTVTGDSLMVSTALAAVQFLPNGSTTASEVVTVEIDDGDEDGSPALMGTITLNSSIIQAWRLAFLGITDDGADLDDPNMNGVPNLLEFLYGFGDPTVATGANQELQIDNPGPTGTITQHGGLTFWADPLTGDVFMRYPRRADYLAAGLDIVDQFSRDLIDFEDATVAPEVIATGTGDGGVPIEAVQIQLPLVLPGSGGKARFGRFTATLNPPQ